MPTRPPPERQDRQVPLQYDPRRADDDRKEMLIIAGLTALMAAIVGIAVLWSRLS